MIIAVNTRLPGQEQPQGYENFIFESLTRLTEKFTQHTFIFIFDKPCHNNQVFTKNVTEVIAGPEASNTLLLQYWFNYRIPALLKKYKADVFVSLDGICSLRTKLPQCLLIQELTFLTHPQFFKKSQTRFYKKFIPEFLAKAKTVATISVFSKTVIIDRYKIASDKIDVVYAGIDEIFKPCTPKEKESIKEKYTDGKEYFLFSGNINSHSNLINLLKAFSFFKKRQKSNMLLLIVGKPNDVFTKALKSFKFRNEVIIQDHLSKDDQAKITAATYAMIYPVLYDEFAIAPLQAMQCEVPVITSNTGALPSLCGNAALYSNPEDFKDIAEKMMLVFKDENKAGELVKAGIIQARQFQWDKTAALLWQCIQKAINN